MEMDPIILVNKTLAGQTLQAIFLPEKGMNLISYQKDGLEVIDQSTRNLFEERYAGLGALIGPHFHHRKPEAIPAIKDESAFPHIARLKAKGIQEPFSHGIGRYAPWKAEATPQKVTAVLTGKDVWNGVPLSALEGQNFTMRFQAELLPEGLKLNLSVVSDTDSLVGIHYYYSLPKRTGFVTSQIQKEYIDGHKKQVPAEWQINERQELKFDLAQSADYTFYPFPNPLEGKIVLDATDYRLTTRYVCDSQENAWQLYHPKEASFVCIEPVSSQDPRHPNLTVSSIEIILTID
jgi:hypothetical protein